MIVFYLFKYRVLTFFLCLYLFPYGTLMCSSKDAVLNLHLLYSPAALRGSFLCYLRKIKVLWRARVKNIIISDLFRAFQSDAVNLSYTKPHLAVAFMHQH